MTVTEKPSADLSALSSVELRGAINQLNERRARRREELEEKRAQLRIAHDDLANADDRRVRGGIDTSKDIADAEKRIASLEREARALSTAHDREIAETEPELAALEAAVPVRELAERAAEHEAAIAALRSLERRDLETFARGMAAALVSLARLADRRNDWSRLDAQTRPDGRLAEPSVDVVRLARMLAPDLQELELGAARLPKVEGVRFFTTGDYPWHFSAEIVEEDK
jgi:hypothetical protein